MLRKVLAGFVGAAVVAAPLVAGDVSMARSSAPFTSETALSGDSNLLFIVGIAAVAAAIILLQEDEEGAPISA